MTFRIVSWNCAQAAHQKLDALMSLKPDVAILPECAMPDVLRSKCSLQCESFEWVGRNRHKGLAVLSFGDYRLARATNWNESFSYLLPVHVSGPVEINLLATWAFGPSDPPTVIPNSANLPKAVSQYSEFLSAPWAVMAGDFNAGAIFDRKTRPMFRSLARDLASRGLHSVLHRHHGWEFGAKPEPTFYDRSKQDAPFHIDYVFSNRPASAVHIGAKSDWRALSDHMPLVIDWGGRGAGRLRPDADRQELQIRIGARRR